MFRESNFLNCRFRIVRHGFVKLNQIIPLLIIILFFPFEAHLQTWQETLENTFDYVETFDQLKDWTGTGTGHNNDTPEKLSGDPSIWDHAINSCWLWLPARFPRAFSIHICGDDPDYSHTGRGDIKPDDTLC